MAVPALQPGDIERAVAEISRVAKSGGIGRFVLPHPESGKRVVYEIDQDSALDMLADYCDLSFADPDRNWDDTPYGSREAALEASISEFAFGLGPPKGFTGRWTKKAARRLLPLIIFKMGLYPWFFTYDGKPERDFFRRARELQRHLEKRGEPVPNVQRATAE